MKKLIICECADQGCPVHLGISDCFRQATAIVKRVDMEDVTGTAFCDGCLADATDSGIYC